MVDYGDLDEWVSTAEAARMLGISIDKANNVLISLGVSVHPFDRPVWPLVRRAYRRDDVEAVIDRLDRELAISVADYAASTGMTRRETIALASSGAITIQRRAFRRVAGGPIQSGRSLSVIVAEPWPQRF